MNKFFEGLKSTVSQLSKKRQLEEKLKLQGVVNLGSEELEEKRKNMFRTSMPIPLYSQNFSPPSFTYVPLPLILWGIDFHFKI